MAQMDITPAGALRRKFVRRTLPTQTAARNALSDLKRRHSSGESLSEVPTLAAFLKSWLKDERKRTTMRSYRQTITNHVIPYLGAHSLTDLSVKRLQAWIGQLLEDGRSAATVRYARIVLRAALTDAQRLEYLKDNPAKLLKVPGHTKRKARSFAPAQLDALLRHSQPWLACWIYVAAILGLRRGEALGLQWDDLNWSACTITIRRTLYDDSSSERPKTEASKRTYLAPPMVWRVLAGHQHRVALESSASGRPVAKWIWATRTGRPLAPRNLTRSFYQARDAAGLQGFRLHDLRATAITSLLGAGRPLTDTQGWVGHADPRTTLGYDEATPSRQLRTSQAIERALPLPKE